LGDRESKQKQHVTYGNGLACYPNFTLKPFFKPFFKPLKALKQQVVAGRGREEIGSTGCVTEQRSERRSWSPGSNAIGAVRVRELLRRGARRAAGAALGGARRR
jgi:hypothetical protein